MSIELQTDPDLDLQIELSTTFLQQVVGVVAQHVGDDRVVGEICVRICEPSLVISMRSTVVKTVLPTC